MRAFLLISVAALGLAACGRDDRAEDANLAVDANLTMDENLALDSMNADANMAADNMVDENATTNATDTNLGNGY